MGYAALIKTLLPVHPNITTCLSLCLDCSLQSSAGRPSRFMMSRAKQKNLLFSLWATKNMHKESCRTSKQTLEWVLVSSIYCCSIICLQASTTSRLMSQKQSLLPVSELEKRLDSPDSSSCGSPEDSYVSVKTKKIWKNKLPYDQET